MSGRSAEARLPSHVFQECDTLIGRLEGMFDNSIPASMRAGIRTDRLSGIFRTCGSRKAKGQSFAL
ncbi:hypothetical protein DCO57_00750 [Labrenzia sp. 011]|nr:hypothetical protein DCO57_00750 [Labrenzia sp. 011]